MAAETETVASDHISAPDEQVEKKEKVEPIGENSVSLSNENEEKHDKVEDAQNPATLLSKTEAETEEDNKDEAALGEVEKTNDSPVLEASVADDLKLDQADNPKSPITPLSKTEEEKEVEDEKAEPAVVEVGKADDSPALEASVADDLKEEKELIPDPQTVNVTEPEPDAAKSQPEEPLPTEPIVKETSQQPEKESEKTREEKQPKAVDIPEAPAETFETSSNPVDVDSQLQSEAKEVAKEKAEEPDHVVTEVQKKSEEPEKGQEEQPNTVAIPEHSLETVQKSSDVFDEKTSELKVDAEVVEETSTYEAGPTEKTESVDTEVDEKPSEPEKQSLEKGQEEQAKIVIPETAAENTEKPTDVIEIHPQKESDIEEVKVTGDSEAVPVETEKPEVVTTEVEEKSREQSELAEKVKEKSEDVETKQELVSETAKSEETSNDTIKDPILLKEEKTDKDEEASIPGSATQVSLNEEAHATPENRVEYSLGIAEKLVEEDEEKESNGTHVVEGVSNEVIRDLQKSEQVSINQEAKTDLNEESEDSAPLNVEEKVAINDEKKEPVASDAVEGSSREAEVEIKKVVEQGEENRATTEQEGVKVESVKDDQPVVDNEKEGQAETKVNEVVEAVREPVRETLASKLEQKEEESVKTGADNLGREHGEDPMKTDTNQITEQPTKETDATKTVKNLTKETPAKPAQKQSNNIISKVKQSLVKAKKAITGKSPSSKNLTTETKGDIKVK